MNNKIYIRTDASILIGTGHVRRCLVIAEQLKDKKIEVIFICRKLEGHLENFIQDAGFKVILLENLPEPPKDQICPYQLQDAHQTSEFLKQDDFLFIDHYSLDKVFEVTVKNKSNAYIMVLDDLLNRMHQCDSFIDYMPFERNHNAYVNKNAKKFLGLKSLPIRKEFLDARQSIKKMNSAVKNILIFMGGNDPDNITGFILNNLAKNKYQYLNIHAVISSSCPHIKALQIQFSCNKNIHIHVQINNMAELLLNTDIAIGSGGTNTWERLYLGVPSIVFQLADNQKDVCAYLSQENLCAYYGNIQNLDDLKFESLFNSFINNHQKLHDIKEKSLEIMPYVPYSDVINYIVKNIHNKHHVL